MYELVCNDLASKQSLFALVIQPRHGCQTLNNFNLEKQPHRTSIISTGSYIAVYSLLVKKINKRYKSSWSEQLLLEHPCKEFRAHRICQHLIKTSTARDNFSQRKQISLLLWFRPPPSAASDSWRWSKGSQALGRILRKTRDIPETWHHTYKRGLEISTISNFTSNIYIYTKLQMTSTTSITRLKTPIPYQNSRLF